MKINIEFPPELEAELLQLAAAAGTDIASFIEQIVESSVAPRRGSESQQQGPQQNFEQRLDAWISLHPRVKHEVDVSRESIYQGRGE